MLPFMVPAQDITGVWKGTISTTEKELPYELVISESDGKLTGYSYTRFNVNGKEMEAVKSIKIKNNNGQVIVYDDDVIYDNFSQSAARSIKQVGTLSITTNGTSMKLDGGFKTRRTREFRILEGKINLVKFDTTSQTSIRPLLDSLKLSSQLSFLQPKGTLPALAIVAPKPAAETIVSNPQIAANTAEMVNVPQVSTSPRKIVADVANDPKPPVVAATHPIAKTPSAVAPPKDVPKTTTTRRVAPPASKPVAVVPPPSKPVVIAAPSPAKPPVIMAKTNQAGTDFTANLAKRSIETIQTLEFKTDSLTLTLYDNGEVDGDTVSIILNGKMLMEKQGLSTKAIAKTIYITPDMGDSLQLVMYAENLGSLPPNTGLLIVKDGNERHEIRFTGDLSKNAGITLRRKK